VLWKRNRPRVDIRWPGRKCSRDKCTRYSLSLAAQEFLRTGEMFLVTGESALLPVEPKLLGFEPQLDLRGISPYP